MVFDQKVCLQLRPVGQPGDPGQAARRPAGEEDQTGIARAQVARLVLEMGVRQDGATTTHVQVIWLSSRVSAANQLYRIYVCLKFLISYTSMFRNISTSRKT